MPKIPQPDVINNRLIKYSDLKAFNEARIMKRIFIYSSRSLFGQGIKSLLDAEPKLDVVGWETELDEAIRHIQDSQPDVVLLLTQSSSDCNLSDGQRFLRAGIKAKIVELNLEDSNVCVYRGEQQTVKEVDELVRIIEQSLTLSPKLLDETEQSREQKKNRE